MFPLQLLHFIVTVLRTISHSKRANVLKMLGTACSAETFQSQQYKCRKVDCQTFSFAWLFNFYLFFLCVLLLCCWCLWGNIVTYNKLRGCRFDSSPGLSLLVFACSGFSGLLPHPRDWVTQSFPWLEKQSEGTVCVSGDGPATCPSCEQAAAPPVTLNHRIITDCWRILAPDGTVWVLINVKEWKT